MSDLLRVVRARVPSLVLWRNGVHRAECPWCAGAHDRDALSFYVYPDCYHCYACGAHGDAIQFLMREEGVGFPAAVQWLAVSPSDGKQAP